MRREALCLACRYESRRLAESEPQRGEALPTSDIRRLERADKLPQAACGQAGKLGHMIVRERPDSFLLFGQHEHAGMAGELARRWGGGPEPFGSTVYAVANHDLAWREPDREVLWNEEKDRPYSFMDYPLRLKLPAQK